MSRGARRALFVDDAANARALLRANVDTLGLGGETRIFRRDARKLGDAPTGEQFSVAFLDPPYGQHLAEQALMALRDGRWLTSDALVVVEESLESDVEMPSGYRLLENARLRRHENSLRAGGKLTGLFLDEGLQPRQSRVPLRGNALQIGLQILQRFGPQLEQISRPTRTLRATSGVLQNAQMFGNCLTR